MLRRELRHGGRVRSCPTPRRSPWSPAGETRVCGSLVGPHRFGLCPFFRRWTFLRGAFDARSPPQIKHPPQDVGNRTEGHPEAPVFFYFPLTLSERSVCPLLDKTPKVRFRTAFAPTGAPSRRTDSIVPDTEAPSLVTSQRSRVFVGIWRNRPFLSRGVSSPWSRLAVYPDRPFRQAYGFDFYPGDRPRSTLDGRANRHALASYTRVSLRSGLGSRRHGRS